MNFDGKVVLVTGAASGIGAATARHFARLNASLSLVDVDERHLKEVGRECGGRVLIIVADLAKDADVVRVVERTVSHYGCLNVLANVAAIFKGLNIQDATMESFDLQFSVNIRGLFHLTILCIPHLIKTKGNIVNVSSAATRRMMSITHVYGMSKAALDYMTKSISVELAPLGVRVNAVSPGVTDTNISNPGRVPYIREMIMEAGAKMNPLGRVCDPSEVARVIAFLVSDDASFVTGAVVPVDGAHRLYLEQKL